MADTTTIQLAQRGLVTLPKLLRDQYGLEAGDILTLIDLGGVFVLSPRRSQVDVLAEQVRGELLASGVSLESMLRALREAREQYDPNER